MFKTKLLLIIGIIFCICELHGRILEVGPGKNYTTPNALYQANVISANDTINIYSAVYSGNDCLAVWREDNLLIRGVGNIKPYMRADGAYILGKGIWVLSGENIHVSNIEFGHAEVPDKNGAGIRLDASSMTASHCYFHDNENGILTSNPNRGKVIIEFCEFDSNGHGDGFSHNLYIGRIDTLIFQFNYSHHAYVGHNLKSRAQVNMIRYNRIMDEEDGESSRLIDLSNGGLSILIGNVLMQGPRALNNNLVGYGLEGLSNDKHEFYCVNNTFINRRSASGLFISVEDGTSLLIANNIFTGDADYINGRYSGQESNNLFNSNINTIGFINADSLNFRLFENSVAIDFGQKLGPDLGENLCATSEYLHPTDSIQRYQEAKLDAGAFEYNPPVSNMESVSDDLLFYPNPASDLINIIEINKVQSIDAIDYLGKEIPLSLDGNSVDISNLIPGNYQLHIHYKHKTSTQYLIKI